MRRDYNGEGEADGIPVYMGFDYTGSEQVLTLSPGEYWLECWGAQGGAYNTGQTGKGGYSCGILTLNETTSLYIYVGGQGSAGTNSNTNGVLGGFNGGGRTIKSSGCSGGGASDIRVGSNSLYSRVIVAGGGGGAGMGRQGSTGSTFTAGGYGGGISGATGGRPLRTSIGTNWSTFSRGGCQTGPGDSNASFGVGANQLTAQTGSYRAYVSAGGGGWYGGGSSAYTTGGNRTNVSMCGAGGSGYVYKSDTASNYPAGCLLTSDYYLANAVTIGGATTGMVNDSGSTGRFPAPPSGKTYETGHTGNGYVKISGITHVETPSGVPSDGVVMVYSATSSYTIPTWAMSADIFLVNGGNAGSGSSNVISYYSYKGGVGGNYFSASGIFCYGQQLNVTIGNGGTGTESNIAGGTTTLQFGGGTIYSPQAQPTTGGSTGTGANGVRCSVNPSDVNLYGAGGGAGKTGYTESGNGYNGGQTGGGTGAYSYISYGDRNPAATDGTFYGAGGGGDATNYQNSVDQGDHPQPMPGHGYQGVAIVKFKPTSS